MSALMSHDVSADVTRHHNVTEGDKTTVLTSRKKRSQYDITWVGIGGGGGGEGHGADEGEEERGGGRNDFTVTSLDRLLRHEGITKGETTSQRCQGRDMTYQPCY